MENIKKIMAVVGLITITSLLLSFVHNADEQAENEEILIMRVVEASVGTNGSICIVDENGKSEKIELEKISKDVTLNMVKINNALNDIAGRGYKLVSTAGGGDNYCVMTTYIFVKN
jgi:hypothetical protein